MNLLTAYIVLVLCICGTVGASAYLDHQTEMHQQDVAVCTRALSVATTRADSFTVVTRIPACLR
jgi:hypothetical protein